MAIPELHGRPLTHGDREQIKLLKSLANDLADVLNGCSRIPNTLAGSELVEYFDCPMCHTQCHMEAEYDEMKCGGCDLQFERRSAAIYVLFEMDEDEVDEDEVDEALEEANLELEGNLKTLGADLSNLLANWETVNKATLTIQTKPTGAAVEIKIGSLYISAERK
jgi:hypothetical protein